MAPDQLQLDFSVAETVNEKLLPQSATVHDLSAARRVRHQVDLGSVYQGIYESVKHVRLKKTTPNSLKTPESKR